MFLVSSCSCLYAIYWDQVISRKWRCSWTRRCSNCIWVSNNFNAYQGASHIRGFTVSIRAYQTIENPTVSKKSKAPRFWLFIRGLSLRSDEFPSQISSNGESASMPWRHQVYAMGSNSKSVIVDYDSHQEQDQFVHMDKMIVWQFSWFACWFETKYNKTT